METDPIAEPGVEARILSVSPFSGDHQSIESCVSPLGWGVLQAQGLSEAFGLADCACVVVCERDLMPGSWLELLHYVQGRPNPPLLIVTSRLADDRLWAEALNLGAWDVLAKPLVVNEVVRSIEQALRHRHCQHRPVEA